MTRETFRVGEAGDLGVDIEQITAFIRCEWKRPIALSSPGFYRWQFLEVPANEGRDRSLVVMDGRGEICGYMGAHRRAFYFGDRVLDGVEITTWVVVEAARGLGLGKQMVVYLQDRYDVILGLSIADLGQQVLISAGFRYFCYIPRFVRVFDVEAVTSITEISSLGHKLIARYAGIPKYPYREEATCPEIAAECMNKLHENFHCYSRDEGYLAWRYAGHPVYRYEMRFVEHGGERAAVVLRVDEKGTLKFVHVMEVFGSEEAVPGVIGFLEDFCRDIGAGAADFYCTTGRLNRYFWANGWFSAVDDDTYLRVAHLLHPVEMRSPATKSLILWAKSGMAALLDIGRLYFTKGDCDFDRPTVDYLDERGLTV